MKTPMTITAYPEQNLTEWLAASLSPPLHLFTILPLLPVSLTCDIRRLD
jgi:hypothetical protein